MVESEHIDQTILYEYKYALQQARAAHGDIKKWIVYAGNQLEMAGYKKDGIASKLRNDLPEISADYITQLCSQYGWTDKRFSRREETDKAEFSQPQSSSTAIFFEQNVNITIDSSQDGNITLLGDRQEVTLCGQSVIREKYLLENVEYIQHIKKKIEFLKEVQKKLEVRPFVSQLDRTTFEEYIYLADRAEELARQAWDERQTIPIPTQFYLAQIVATSTIKHGASEYLAKVKQISNLSSKQVTKTLKGIVRGVHCLYEPTNQMEALMDGFYGKPCEKCGSWRVKWENGICRCFCCEHEYKAKAERLPLARELAAWSN